MYVVAESNKRKIQNKQMLMQKCLFTTEVCICEGCIGVIIKPKWANHFQKASCRQKHKTGMSDKVKSLHRTHKGNCMRRAATCEAGTSYFPDDGWNYIWDILFFFIQIHFWEVKQIDGCPLCSSVNICISVSFSEWGDLQQHLLKWPRFAAGSWVITLRLGHTHQRWDGAFRHAGHPSLSGALRSSTAQFNWI